MNEPLGHLAVIGGGLIGSSLLRAARERLAAEQLTLIDRDASVLAVAQELGLADHYSAQLADAATADLVILAVPVGTIGDVAAGLAQHLKPGAIVSDVGSVKASVLSAMQDALPDHVSIVPGHPVAGTEESGPRAGFASLFEGRWCILTPPGGAANDTDIGAISMVTAFWQRLGSKVEIMDAKHHDLVLAITSHVPHLIAYNIVGTASDLEEVTQSEVITYSAGGFRDFTRIAASDPTMWRDVFLNNKEAVLEMLGRFTEDLAALTRAIRWDDGDALHTLFSRTRAIRRDIIEAGQESDAKNFGRDEQAGD